jgi:hypothetical protein
MSKAFLLLYRLDPRLSRLSAKFSSSFAIFCGVSQGSTQGPLLYNIFISDMYVSKFINAIFCLLTI